MARSLGISLAVFLMFSFPVRPSIHAQSAQSFGQPATDDINLYYGALRFVGAVYSDSLKAQKPDETATMQFALRKELGVSEPDLAILVREAVALRSTDGVAQGLTGANTSATATVASGQQAPPTGALAIGVNPVGADKLDLTSQAVQRLQAGLSPDGWANFRTFVNGPFLRSIHIVRGPAPAAEGVK
jgi:hypothetical protein